LLLYNTYSYRGETKTACASGFVGTLTINGNTITVLVTNNHVFPTREQARKATFCFGYQSTTGSQPEEIEGEKLIDENALFKTNKVSVMVTIIKWGKVIDQFKCLQSKLYFLLYGDFVLNC